MPNVATLPTDVASLQRLVLEQQHMIDTLKANLHLALHRQFGRRNESVDVDQIGLFAGSAEHGTIIELDVAPVEPASSRSTPEPSSEPDRAPRKQAVRILKDLPREIRIVDLPDAEKVCSGCGGALHHCGDETSEHLTYVPAAVKVLETRRKKYVCTTPACSGEVKRAASPRTEPLAKGMASASLLAFLIVSKFADGLPLYRIAALDPLWVEMQAPATDVASLARGSAVRIEAGPQAGRRDAAGIVGRVIALGQSVDAATQTLLVRAEVRAPAGALRPGQTVVAAVEVPGAASVRVPAAAVVDEGGAPVVFVEEAAGTFRRVPVTLGGSADGTATVTGIEAGARVVVQGTAALKAIFAAPPAAQ